MPLSIQKLTLPIFLALALSMPAQAETCEERFKALLIDGNDAGPVKIHVTQEIAGGMASKNYFYQLEDGHWMTEMLEPANQAWVLTYENTMFTSADKGETWTKIRTLDSAGNGDAAKAAQKANAETTKNASCGQEDFEGVAYHTVEADYSVLTGFKTENHFKYWVHPDTGYIRKVIYEMKGDNFESKTTQLLEKALDLALPTPKP